MSNNILEAENIRRSFGGIIAVDGVSLELEKGKITGLIGPNGAGKTTTFNLLSGTLIPDNGSIQFKGSSLQEVMEPSKAETGIWMGAGILFISIILTIVLLYVDLSSISILIGIVVTISIGVGAFYKYNDSFLSNMVGLNRRPHMAAQEGLIRTFQITRELDELTVLENMLLATPNHEGEQLHNVWLKSDVVKSRENHARSRALEIIELLELTHLKDNHARSLSGGQRKLLELGRALMTDPDLILLDEPVAGVNPTLQNKIIKQIKKLQEEGLTICLIEHNMGVVMDLCDTVIVMNDGKKLFEGEPSMVRRNEQVIDAYLGG